jgi:hypothetical protein
MYARGYDVVIRRVVKHSWGQALQRAADEQGPGHREKRSWMAAATESGSILLTTLGVAVSSTMLASVLLLAIQSVDHIRAMQVSQRQAYWLARSQVGSVVSQFRASGPCQETIDVPSPAGDVQLWTERHGDWVISAMAQVGEATDIVRAVYNPDSGRVVDWLDNAPKEYVEEGG